jgi:hypothetical protein
MTRALKSGGICYYYSGVQCPKRNKSNAPGIRYGADQVDNSSVLHVYLGRIYSSNRSKRRLQFGRTSAMARNSKTRKTPIREAAPNLAPNSVTGGPAYTDLRGKKRVSRASFSTDNRRESG